MFELGLNKHKIQELLMADYRRIFKKWEDSDTDLKHLRELNRCYKIIIKKIEK